MKLLAALLLLRSARSQLPPGAYIPIVVQPCGTPASAPGQFFLSQSPRAAGSGGRLYESALYAGTCIYSQYKDSLLYLAPCNTSDSQQHYSWGKGSGGFVAGGGGCWGETASPPGGPAGDTVGLFGCGAGQGVFEFVTVASSNLQIISNYSQMCLTPSP